MKVLNLQLIAFGCFTNARLDFDQAGCNFQVIYGSNETGKSTALRALTGLLYGIPSKTQDAFLHEPKDLRIAAELERADRSRVLFCRRKGNRDTLLNSEGKPVPEALLLEYLRGVSEEIFATMFRLDHVTLVRGGQDLLAGKGDVAESLFQAGTGITGLREVLSALEAEAAEMFKPRSSTAHINKAIEAYEAARKRSRDLAVPAKQWVEQAAALAQKEADLQHLVGQIGGLRTEKSRLERFRFALQHVARRNTVLEELAILGQVILLSESAPRDRDQALQQQREASARKVEAEEKIARLQDELNKLQLPQELLAQAEVIAGIHERLHGYRLAVRDLPKVRGEQHQLEADARTILAEVKPGLALENAHTLHLTVVQRSRIQKLAGSHSTLQERVRATRDRADSVRREWNGKKQQSEQFAPPKDCSELERAIERTRKQGDLEATLRSETTALREAEEQATVELKRLGLWSGSLEEVESLPVPPLETIDRFDSDLTDIANEQKLHKKQSDETHQKAAKLEGEVHALRLGGAVPTEQELIQARARRNEGWQLVRLAWLEGVSDPAQQKQFDPDKPLPEAYEQTVAAADVIADRLRREAERVATLAGLLADKESCDRRVCELQEETFKLSARLEAFNQQWQAMWQATAITPLPPKEMRAWLARHATLAGRVRDLRARRQTIAQLQERITDHADELSQVLGGLGEATRGAAETLAALVQRSQAYLQRLKEAHAQRATLENEVKRLAAEHDKALREHNQAETALATWQAEWQTAVAPLGLPGETRAEEAGAILETLDSLFKKIDDSHNRRTRVQDMEQHIAQFTGDVAALTQTLAPDLRELPADHAATSLHARLAHAQQDAARRHAIEKQLGQEGEALENAETALGQATRRLQSLMEKAHCTDLAALEEAEQKSARSRQLTAQFEELNKTLAAFTAGSTLQRLIEELAAVNADQLPFQIEELDRQIQSLETQRSQLEQQIGGERAALKAIDGSDAASAAAEEAQSALAAARAGTERYLRLRLESEILRHQIERYREQNQDPVIRRTSEVFPRITLGSFTRLKTGFDDKDRPVLLGVRPSGEDVEVSGMSDGTRDQLFLALRLASLERQLGAGEPLPLVLDDILINFDDDRAKATLALLAELAHRTQVLFFTHHSRLAELALEAVPAGLLMVQDLRNSPSSGK